MELIRSFADAGKPVAAICHASWLLVEPGVAEGRRMTSYGSVRTDIRTPGPRFGDETVVTDGNIITSRNPADLDAFVDAMNYALG